jgi:hypothetical protein
LETRHQYLCRARLGLGLLASRNTRPYRGLNRCRWFGTRMAPASALIR